MKNKYKKYGGYTLVEMIISIAILGMIMTPIYTMLIVSQKSNKDGSTKQTVALKGQEIFEEIKSEDIEQTTDSEGKINGIKIWGIEIPSPASEGEKEISGDGYKVKVKITKNTSINLEENTSQEAGSKVETVNFNGIFSGTESPITVKLNGIQNYMSYSSQDDVLKLVVNSKTIENKKIVEVKDRLNNSIITSYELVEDSKKDDQINLILNFEQYKVKKINDENSLRPVEVNVYNQDSIPLNISLQKSTSLDVNVNTKIGNVRVFDNRSGDPAETSEWYDIKVEAIEPINGEEKVIFTEQTSQKIKVNGNN
ncbi:prepilin-type N-terminal cleavage/methylation domain-containing protein [Clostridium sp. SHJSY1]|uniref:type II secretion system protein n=1 Tax=Clostridium sp. SHJSY1 TaxID=2942483 RepID=UPI0028767C66|nr:prepilin-type N-terminal cleavage/methylation domain-containing protein [Clostridium sp. SHJSY1]MDS0525686.1 prepilin-type N-terminal cleavage/methylation domain-containing protein [Clostridium sp. SHJSY1]